MTVKYHHFTRTWDLGDLYTCELERNEVFADSRIHIDSVEGDHDDGKTIDDCEALIIAFSSNVKFFPQNLGNFFKHLKLIQIYDSNLTEITESDLKPFQQLQVLFLNYNKIKTLSENVFKHNQQLKLIWVSHNEIHHIHPNTFNGLPNLEDLAMDQNDCKTPFYWAQTRADVVTQINQIRAGECTNDEFYETFNKLNELSVENDNFRARIDELNEKVKKLAKNVSKLSDKVSLQSTYIQEQCLNN